MEKVSTETAIDHAVARVRSYSKARAVVKVEYVAGYVRVARTKRGDIYVEVRDKTGNVIGIRTIKRKSAVKSRVWRPLGWLKRLVSWLGGVRAGA